MTAAAPEGPVLLDGGPGALLAGHLAAGAGPAHVAVLRTGALALFRGVTASPSSWWSSPAVDAGEARQDAAGCATAAGIHHGVNARGLLCACRPGGPAAVAGLAGAVLARAGGAEEAAALVAAAAPALDGPDTVWVVDPGGGHRLEVDGGEVRRHPLAVAGDGGLDTARDRLRDAPGACAAISAIAARLDGSGASLLVCLGPPSAGIFVRQWPGLPPPPELTGAADRPPSLGALATALAARPAQPGDAEALGAAEAEALTEGEEAERLARIMDAAGDDHGAEVRRALAQAHAAGLAGAALELRLSVGRGRPGPSL